MASKSANLIRRFTRISADFHHLGLVRPSLHARFARGNRALSSRFSRASLETLEARLALDSTAVLNEVMYHPRTEDGPEWVEIYNQQGVDLEISGWRLSGAIEFTFPQGTVMDGGSYLVVSADPARMGVEGSLGPFAGSLSNGGEEIVLLNNNDRVMDSMDYTDSFPWVEEADGAGASLAKRSVNTASGDPANWTYSAQVGGTPGAVNFSTASATFETVDLIATGSNARVHIPTNGNLGTNWVSPEYSEGANGESWQSLPTNVGFEVGNEVQNYQQVVLVDNPLAYYRFGEASPQSPAVNLGTLGASVNGTYASTALVGAGSLLGEAGDGALRITSADSVTPFQAPGFEKVGAAGRAVEFWLRVDALPSGDLSLVSDAVSALDLSLSVYLRPSGQLRIIQRTDVSFPGLSLFDTVQVATPGEAVHVVVTWDAVTKQAKVYLDGAESAQSGQTGTPPTGNAIETNNQIYVGRDGRTNSNPSVTIDEVAFYNYPLSAVRVSAHHLAGLPQFASLIASDVTASMHNVSSSAYLRQTFEVPDNIDLQRLSLDLQYDDAYIAYIDGVEVSRSNFTGTAAFNSTADSSRSFEQVRQRETVQLLPILGEIEPGTHTLAIHALNASAADGDFLIGFELSAYGVQSPPSPTAAIRLNEISGAAATVFQIELQNDSDQAVDLQGYRLVVDGVVNREYVFPSQTIVAGGFVSVTEQQLGFRPADGDRVFIYSADGASVLDGRQVTNRLRGRSEDHDGRWLYPAAETPNAANTFDINSDIVINEIFYNAPIQRARDAVVDIVDIMPFNNVWRYNNTGASFPTGWEDTAHTVDNTLWFQGPGPVGRTGDVLPVPLGTLWPSQNLFTRTYYFETEMVFESVPEGYDLALSLMIDDGAIIYLNGQEIHRVRMPEGPVDSQTLASQGVANATLDEPVILPSSLFVVGTNRISVELHMALGVSTEAVMGLAVQAFKTLSPATPQYEPEEQWIELYNKGDQPVDLSGWEFTDAIGYEIPNGTVLGAGEYLVVANDAAALSAKYPTIEILGDFDGNLARSGERLELVDLRGNPVDTVDYRDGGRWDGLADGRGSSLELRDPHADNAMPEAWQASDESADAPWQTITYRGRATTTFGPTQWNEFVLGLLDSGEVLLDDISVVEDPDGAARQVIQNGTFEADADGSSASTWRIIGTHELSYVQVDPTDPSNHVLRLVATGPTEHMHNHAETTLRTGGTYVTINGNLTYEISLRAKWLSGSDLLNTRLYFNRLPATTPLLTTTSWGTPGQQNSSFVANIGPTYANLAHGPTVPAPDQDVLVSVTAEDPDGIASMRVVYAVDGGQYLSAPMVLTGGSHYSGLIPARSSGAVVQFYVEATDSQGAVSTFPAAGADSRALYVVEDGRAGTLGSHNLRIVMTGDDADRLHEPTNVMSNARIGGTLIYNETEVYYDIGVRLKGSERGRNENVRVGFNLSFDPLQLFRGAQGTVGIDRSGAGDQFSQKEVLVKQTLNHAGGITDFQDDLIYVIAPRTVHTGSALLQMSRYNDIFLDSQWENGSDGQLYKYELVYYPTTSVGGVEGLKMPEPDNVLGVGVSYRTDSKEDYRWTFLTRNKTAEDDYSRLINALRVMSLTGTAYHEQSRDALDVDFWLRNFAMLTLWGVGDNYGTGGQHNAYFYIRPSDGKLLYLPHDVDFSGSAGATSALVQNSDLTKMLTLPENQHYYYGHMLDIIQTSFNSTYMNSWIDHYDQFLTSPNLQSYKTYISQRAQFALSTINSSYPSVNFAITTNSGNNFTVPDSVATLAGTGWLNVREIRLAGSDVPLNVSWPTASGWQMSLPVGPGANALTLEAYDNQGALIGTDTITVTSEAANPVLDSLRISEFNYHPQEPTGEELAENSALTAEDFEFIEFMNVGDVPINPVGVTFTAGLDYTFPSITLNPGQRVIVAGNTSAFAVRYGTSITPVGQFISGRLSNSGERLTLVSGLGETIVDFSYTDQAPWPEHADGAGATVELIEVAELPATRASEFQSWRGSVVSNGTPGEAPVGAVGIVINEVLATSAPPATRSDSIELFNAADIEIDLSGWYLSDSAGNLLKYQIPLGTVLAAGEYLVIDESSFNPNPTSPGPNDFALSGTQGDEVWLVIAEPSGRISQFVDHVAFGAMDTGATYGRTSTSTGLMVPLSRPSLGWENGDARPGSVIISELNPNPGLPSGAALAIEPAMTADDLEFVELYNASTETVNLAGWRLRGGADYDFVEGEELESGEVLVLVSFDPTDPQNASRLNAFRAHYGIGTEVAMSGGLGGQLRDSSERIDLQQPGIPPVDNPTVTPYLSSDAFYYDNFGDWTAGASGTGMSLRRVAAGAYGDFGTSWAATAPTPGLAEFNLSVPGDFNADGIASSRDIDLLLDAIRDGRSLTFFDIDSNTVVDSSDLDALLANVFDTRVGDANLDGSVDGVDLGIWSGSAFRGGGTWARGDLNGDGVVDARDFNLWNAHKFQSAPAVASAARTPRAALSMIRREDRGDTTTASVDMVLADSLAKRSVRWTMRDRDAAITRRAATVVASNARQDDSAYSQLADDVFASL